MTQKLDRRVRRTRKLLSGALLNLLLTKDYDDITIQDITEEADLNRATFYLHYGTKEELLIAALESRFDDLVERIEENWKIDVAWSDYTDMVMVFEHAAENAALYKVLLGARGRTYVVNRIIDYIAASGRKACELSFDILPEFESQVDLINRHVAGSMYALLSWWIMNDMPFSAEYMAATCHQLCTNGVLPLLSNLPIPQP